LEGLEISAADMFAGRVGGVCPEVVEVLPQAAVARLNEINAITERIFRVSIVSLLY
jgi:hypothetical protein